MREHPLGKGVAVIPWQGGSASGHLVADHRSSGLGHMRQALFGQRREERAFA